MNEKKEIMFATLIIVLSIVIAVLLVLVILPQNPKGGGLSPQMGGVAQVAGTQKTTDILEKITWGMAASILILSILANVVIRSEGTKQGGFSSPNEEAAKGKSVGDVTPTQGETGTGTSTGTETPKTEETPKVEETPKTDAPAEGK